MKWASPTWNIIRFHIFFILFEILVLLGGGRKVRNYYNDLEKWGVSNPGRISKKLTSNPLGYLTTCKKVICTETYPTY